MMSVTPSSSKPPDPRWDYDIYVSFIGDKTSYDFLYYLFGGLGRNGIVTFRPPPPRGENIPTLAIQRSRNFMVVLSQDYLSSEYCLNELVEIVDRKNIKDHIFFPILYQLGPSDVQRRIETLEEAFPTPEGQFGASVDQRMQGWIAALTEVLNSSDQILHDDANGSMGILKFVEKVLDVVCTRLIIPRNTLRMDSCVEMMTAFLNLGTSEIYIVGMSCVDELIKETLIEVVYSQIHNRFERTSFISNISEISISPSGLFGLQEELLGDMGGNEVNIKNGDEGISLIEEAIQGKRVLIVLDNVDELKQLHTLIGNSKCFGPGSRVIAVSRDKQLRTELEAHGKHKFEDLHDWKSPQLFIWRTSMMAHPAEDFSDEDDHYLQLKNKGHDYEVKFNSPPNSDLSAEDFWDEDDHYLQQNIFDPPIKLLSAGEGSGKQITLEPDEEVVFDITPYYMPASQTLNLSGTGIRSLPKSIFGLVGLKRLILRYSHDSVELPPKVGELVQLEVLDLEGTWIRDLPEKLRCPMLLELYLHRNRKLRMVPPSFFDGMRALQILNLSYTNITHLPESIVKLVSLKKLILSYCVSIRKLQREVGKLEQLEVLDLQGTKIGVLPVNLRWPMLIELYLHNNDELSTIPPLFFNYMPALQTLNLSRTYIRSLPKSIVKLVSLKRLDLSCCKYFVELQPGVGELKQLEVLHLEVTKIRDLPENLRCPMLLELHLHRNPILRRIPPSFFDYMPALQILNVSQTNISSLPKSIVKLVSLKRLILSNYRLFSKGGGPKQLEVLELEGREIRDLHERVIDLEGKDLEIMHLPAENPSHPKYFAVFLHNNLKLKTIPTSFFNYMPFLEVLNLSRTGIRSLPESIFTLESLKILILSYCHRFLRLSPEVGKLKRLEVLDLEGTEIMDLPEEIKELNNLTCLNLSFYGYMGDGSSVMESDAVQFPRGVISALSHLEELMISVNPDDERWNACVENIVIELRTLRLLKTLLFYFPRVKLVSDYLPNWQLWSFLPFHFRFIVGHHVKRIMSRRPRGVELELERWERCLEYINGDLAIPKEIKALLQYSTAFFLERHVTVKKLSDFGIENMKKLKCCVVGECNEVKVIIDETDAHEEDVVLGSLEYLCIYYMKNLRSIWQGPIQTKCLSLLKFLTLRTCPKLTTIFTTGLLGNLCNLEDLTIDDCPSIKTLVSCEVSTKHKTSHFLPNLKRMSLHYMPGLVSISSGLHIAPRLELLSFYDCPNLKNLLIEEVSSKDLKKIEGERSWWQALEWSTDRPAYLDDIFVPINIEDC